MSKDESGFIVNAWRQIFGSLGSMSVFATVGYFVHGGEGDASFSEKWTLGNFFFSIAYLFLFSYLSTQRYITTIILVYAAYRIFEIMVYHINIFLSLEGLQGFRRSVVLLFHNYIEVLFWFASFYRLLHYFFSKPFITRSLGGSLYFSIVTMTTLGYGDIEPINEIGRAIVSVQTLIGIFMAIFLLARFVSMLPQRGTRDREEIRASAKARQVVDCAKRELEEGKEEENCES